MHKTSVRVRTVAATVAVLGLAGAGMATSAAAAPHAASGKPLAFTIGGNEGHQVAVLHGAITDAGKDKDHNQYDLLVLQNGSLRLNHPEKDSHFVPHINKKTCYATFKITGSWSIGKSTGDYKGMTGNGTYVAHGVALLKRTKSGGCDMNGKPVEEVFTVTGHGRVK